MEKIKFDFSDIEEAKQLEQGRHVLSVDQVVQCVSKKGDDMIKFVFRHHRGQMFYHYCLNTPKNRWALRQTLESILNKKMPSSEIDIDIDDIINRKVIADIVHDTYNNKTVAKIKAIYPDKGSGATGSESKSNTVLDDDMPF